LDKLFRNARLARLADQNARYKAKAYSPQDLLRDLRNGVWHELADPAVKIDPFRSQLQRSYVQVLAQKLDIAEVLTLYDPANVASVELGATDSSDTARAYLQDDLRALRSDIIQALSRAADAETRAHLRFVCNAIDSALDVAIARPRLEKAHVPH
jgi:hypothetical protein